MHPDAEDVDLGVQHHGVDVAPLHQSAVAQEVGAGIKHGSGSEGAGGVTNGVAVAGMSLARGVEGPTDQLGEGEEEDRSGGGD